MLITLPHDNNRTFHISTLIQHLINQRRDVIIQGQQSVTFDNLTKQSSLDYWIRASVARKKNTKQAVNDVVNQICATGIFEAVDKLICPDTGRLCKCIRLINTP